MTKLSLTTFTHALEEAAVTDFLAGTPPYFFEAKVDNEEPQNVNEAFNLAILPAWRESYDERIPTAFANGLQHLLKDNQDPNKAIYLTCYWLWLYTYYLKDKHSNPDSAYGDLFEVDLSDTAALLKEALEINSASLKSDLRWAGAEWNSKEGLWEPLVRLAIVVKDQLEGPDFVPVTEHGE